jgi:hypothetical protein
MKTKIYSILFIVSFGALAYAQNLLTNGTFESGNTGFESTYFYTATDTYPPRTYSIVHSPHDTHARGASFGDHTTGTGCMLVANGSSDPRDVVWRQTVDVQQNRDYAFSGFAASWGHYPGSNEDPSPPFMLIFINGQQQTKGVQVTRVNGQWQNFTAVWNSGDATQAIIEIRLGSTAADGNDIALDDLSFRLLALRATLEVTTHPAIEVAWPSEVNRLYQPQWSPDLDLGHWFDLGPQVQGTGSEISVFDKTRMAPKRFYRILAIE